jgi:hypothetical protein
LSRGTKGIHRAKLIERPFFVDSTDFFGPQSGRDGKPDNVTGDGIQTFMFAASGRFADLMGKLVVLGVFT